MEKQEMNFKGLAISGFIALLLYLPLLAGTIYPIVLLDNGASDWWALVLTVFVVLLLLLSCGFLINEPNNARVLLFFGNYRGTFRKTGFYWLNPFYRRKKVTFRARNLDVSSIKVNDKMGNPIMIGMVLIWKLADTYKAVFDIDASSFTTANNNNASNGYAVMRALEKFVNTQSDAALREVAGNYAYDDNESAPNEAAVTLRSGGDTVNQHLEKELNARLQIAGIDVVEARINNLAYAPEIAAVMLRRQQATAIIAAREKIVEGAVSMVELALRKLDEGKVVSLDEEKKATMVSNLLVVLCSDEAAQPVVNAGSLY